MSFSDIFKSSFLESVTEFSAIDTLIGMAFALVIGLFIFVIYKKTFSGVMYSTGTSGNDKSDNATDDSKRPSFSGMPGQSGSQGIVKNLITIGICLIVMIAAFFIIRAIKRKK